MTIAYRTMHETRLKMLRGKASDQVCPCGAPAKQWAYQHTGNTIYSPEGRAYSENPDDYIAMCISCHMRLDIERTPERFPYILSKKRAGKPKFRRCLECGEIARVGFLGPHLKASGHTSYEDVD